MKTFLVRNRFGRESQVPENIAMTLKGNPSMTIIGELKTEIERKKIRVPQKGKSAALVDRAVAKIVEVVKGAVPGSDQADIEYTGNMIKQKTVITKSGKEYKKSSVLHE